MEQKAIKVLIIEDDKNTVRALMALKEQIEKNFLCSVLISANISLLNLLKEEHYDLLIVDLMIHSSGKDEKGQEYKNIYFEGVNWKKTGIEFVRQIRQGAFWGESGIGTPPTVPIIVLSAITDVGADSFTGLEDINYCDKPFRFDDLINRIEKVIKKMNYEHH
jgi:CheY-like chemotaxis protein